MGVDFTKRESAAATGTRASIPADMASLGYQAILICMKGWPSLLYLHI